MKSMIYTTHQERNVLAEGAHEGYNYIIFSLGTHPTAYVQVPDDHPSLEGLDVYDMDYSDFDWIEVHGGITWAEPNLPQYESEGFWVGWDYNHYQDFAEFYLRVPGFNPILTKWTTEEIFEHVKDVIAQLRERKND